MPGERFYFISDAHLGAAYFSKAHPGPGLLIKFCRSIEGTAKTLYLVGDIFDFWYEWKSVIPAEHFGVIAAFKRLAESGTRILYVAGNHDFWFGDFLTREVGIEVSFSPVCETIAGKRMLIQHGHGMLGSDWVNRFLRKILKNRFTGAWYRMLHPAQAIWLAKAVSGKSRQTTAKYLDMEKIKAKYRAGAADVLADSAIDILVIGHTHSADLVIENGKTYVNTGNWMRDFDYTVFENGTFTQHRFTGA